MSAAKRNSTCKGTSGWGYTKNYYSGILGTCQSLYALGLIPSSYGYSGCQNSDGSTTTLSTSAPKRRALSFAQIELEKERSRKCPSNLLACPMKHYNGTNEIASQDYECVSDNELNRCGSCNNDVGCPFFISDRPSSDLSVSVQCEAIPHATSVSCSEGRCTVHHCRKGYISTGQRCVPKTSRGTKRRGTLHSKHSR